MNPERWQEVKNVLATALEIPRLQRPAYLDEKCDGDTSLRSEVESLLADESGVSSFLNENNLAEIISTTFPRSATSWIGQRVGPYRIVDQIGIGGMGEVYRAFRDDQQYRKDVALKVVRTGQDFDSVIHRFKNERQILATLEHPNIARLLDGGTTESGAPYFVMELIEGQPITEYCDQRKLSVGERLLLFSQVCAAVHYAHQRLIIHRDIKPGNILVTPDGSPKLLDFGIAKIIAVDSISAAGDRTLPEFRIFTPRYASPEQIAGQPMTTAADVYSLGVVLYELLTGASPYGATGTSVHEIADAVCTREPRKPSLIVLSPATAANAQTPDITTAADARGTIPGKLSKQLGGDLDNIILMALRKEPARRYASVEQFAEDIRRSLNNLPVAARHDSIRYRTTKFIHRHSVGVAASLAVGISLVSGLGIALHERNVARQQRARAERRFNDVRSLANSLIFDVHDSIKELPGSTPARKMIVDRALEYLNGLVQESAGDLGLQRELAAAYERVGAVQGDYLENNLGDSEGTLVSYKKGLDIRKQIDKTSSDWTDHLALAQSYRLVAHQLWATGDLRSARQQIDQAISISENLSRSQLDNLKILYELSFDHEVSGAIGFPDDPSPDQKTIQEYRRALAADEASLRIQPDDVRTLHGFSIDLSHIGGILEGSDPQGALENYRKALEINQKLAQLSPELRYKRSVAIAYGSIASVYDDIGDYPNAAANDLKDLAIYKEMIQSDPRNALLRQGLAITYANTATALNRIGNIATAIDYSAQAVAIMRSLVESAPKNTRQQFVLAAVLASRATILLSAKKWIAATEGFENARSIYESLSSSGEPENRVNVAACDVKLGESAARSGRDSAAEQFFRQALSIAEPSLSKKSPDLDTLYVAADAYSGLGDLKTKTARQSRQQPDWAAARSLYLQSQATWRKIDHPNHTAPNSFEVGDPKDVAKHLQETELAPPAAR